MKRSELSRSKGVSLVAGAALALYVGLSLIPAGCGNNDFLGLEDYQRDFLVWLLHNREDSSGLACWDLNGNGVKDPEEDQNEDGDFNVLDCQGLRCWDLDGNGVEDLEEDINEDGRFDVHDCGDVELVFVLDTSDSMRDDVAAGLFDAIKSLSGHGRVVRSTLYGITGDLDLPADCWDLNDNGVGDLGEDANCNGELDPAEDANGNGELDPGEDVNCDGMVDVFDCTNIAPEFYFENVVAKTGRCAAEPPDFTCVTKNVKDEYLTCIAGTGGRELDDNEDWGCATAVVAECFEWLPGVVKIVVPISDESPEDPPDVAGVECDASDLRAINEAICAANKNQVFVIPIVAQLVRNPLEPLEPRVCDIEACVFELAERLANGTGASSVTARFPCPEGPDEIRQVVQAVLDATTSVVNRGTVLPDCNGDGTPDACDIAEDPSLDCNDNGTPDACDIDEATSEDANLDGVPDECEPG